MEINDEINCNDNYATEPKHLKKIKRNIKNSIDVGWAQSYPDSPNESDLP